MDTTMISPTSLLNEIVRLIAPITLFPSNEDKAMSILTTFLQTLPDQYTNLNMQDKVARDIEHIYLVSFYRDINISDTDYELKTKIKAIFIAAFIRHTWQLHLTREPSIESTVAINDGVQRFFESVKTEVLEMLSKQPEILDPVTGTPLPKLNIDTFGESQINSLVRFYAAIKEAQRWQTHAKWDKLAFFTASLSVGEGVLYLPGYPSSAPEEEIRLRKHFFAIMERIANPYNQCVKKRKAPIMMPMFMMPPVNNQSGETGRSLDILPRSPGSS